MDASNADLDRIAKIAPEDWPGLFARREIAYRQGRYDEALELYRESTRDHPGFADAMVNLAWTFEHLRRPAEALAALDNALLTRPEFRTIHQIHTVRGQILKRLQRNEEALVSYDRALELHPDDPDALCGRGSALYNSGRPQEALLAFDRAIAVRPSLPPFAHFARGATLHWLGRSVDARTSLSRFLELAPDHPQAPEARRMLEQIPEEEPRNAE